MKYLSNFFKDEQGMSISLVLSILVIISTFLLLYFGAIHHSRTTVKNEIAYYNASLNANSGMNFAKNLTPLKVLKDQHILNYGNLKATVKRYKIGFSEHVSSVGEYQGTRVERHSVFLVHYPLFKDVALMTRGKSFFNPIYITGNTSINGNVYTGRYGVSKQSMKDIYYKKKRLVEGTVYKHDKSRVPEVDDTALTLILKEKETTFNPEIKNQTLYLNFQTVKWESIKDYKISSIVGPGTLLLHQIPTYITHFKNVNVLIDQSVTLTQKEQFTQCMIYSKSTILINTELTENQFISESKIELGNVAQLLGTNLILVKGKQIHFMERIPRIVFSPSSQYSGDLVYISPKGYDYREQLKTFDLPKTIRLNGLIYSPFGVPSEIKLDGTLLFNYTQVKYRGTTYQNYIKDYSVWYMLTKTLTIL